LKQEVDTKLSGFFSRHLKKKNFEQIPEMLKKKIYFVDAEKNNVIE